MLALTNLTDRIRNNSEEKVIRTERRITWQGGLAYVQQREIYGRYTLGGYRVRHGDWRTVRLATQQDMLDRCYGRIAGEE